jgi:hypothetical protein
MGQVARMKKMRNEYKILVGNPEDKRPFVILRLWYVVSIKLDLKDISMKEYIRLMLFNDGFL